MIRHCALLLLASATAACSALPVVGGGSQGPAAAPRSAPQTRAPVTDQCLRQLGADGARFTPLPDRYIAPGCSNLGTVQLQSFASDNAALVATNLGPVTCGVSRAFAGWARFGVDRAAVQLLGSPIRSIETMGSYSCRNVAGTNRKSAHATGEAIDIAAFVLENGRRVSVRQDWNGGDPRAREFLRVVRQSACKRFGTVLSPDYNAAHHDHLHLEGTGDGSAFCR
ncbi:MAG: extensin [Sphingomonadales bacterium 32-68-7]|nr:MAG: extensin [Sphingomonadales bacterium 12-68-11]OYX08171.1 MAG: extensin [Sphingomonadales bacterium 32-68-7]